MSTTTNSPRHSSRQGEDARGRRILPWVMAAAVLLLVVAGYLHSH